MQDVLEVTASEVSDTAPGKSPRTDTILRWLVILGVVGVLALGGLFGYSVWQEQQTEDLSTPAGRAIADFKQRVKASPNDAPLRVRMGEALASAGLYDDAVEQLRIAIKLDPKHTGAYLDLGILAMQKKETKTAEGYFNKVIELTTGSEMEDVNQRRETAFFYIGEIALDAKRYEDAAANFKAALRIRRDASDTYYLLAQAYKGMERSDAAMKQLEAALAFDPNYAEAHYLMGQIYLEEDDKINAAEHFRLAAEAAPDQDLAQEALAGLGTAEDAVANGRELLADGKPKRALEAALLARALDPKSVEAALFHGEAAEAAGEEKAAISAYKAVLEIDAENETAKAALARLQPKK